MILDARFLLEFSDVDIALRGLLDRVCEGEFIRLERNLSAGESNRHLSCAEGTYLVLRHG